MGITPRYPKRHLQPQNPQRPTNPNNQITHASHPFSPNTTRAIEQDGLGGSPYLVSKIIPQREGFLLFSDLTPQGRRPRVGQPGRDEGLVLQSFRRGQKATSYFSDTNATRAIEQNGLAGPVLSFQNHSALISSVLKTSMMHPYTIDVDTIRCGPRGDSTFRWRPQGCPRFLTCPARPAASRDRRMT